MNIEMPCVIKLALIYIYVKLLTLCVYPVKWTVKTVSRFYTATELVLSRLLVPCVHEGGGLLMASSRAVETLETMCIFLT